MQEWPVSGAANLNPLKAQNRKWLGAFYCCNNVYASNIVRQCCNVHSVALSYMLAWLQC